MVVLIYNGERGSYIREGRLKIMGAMGSYQPWEKDHQAMTESGKLGQTEGYYAGGRLGYLEVISLWAFQGRREFRQRSIDRKSRSIRKVKGH